MRPLRKVAVCCAVLTTILFGCNHEPGRTINVTKEMTWECAPDEHKPAFYARPDEYVRFRFVEEPRCFDVESARNLCGELRSIGKPIVSVQFEVWPQREGYRIVSVEGTTLSDVGGWGHNGANDFAGECPISKVIKSLRKQALSR